MRGVPTGWRALDHDSVRDPALHDLIKLAAAKSAGAEMIYVAMFDEVDEGTAIFKCTNDVPPDGESKFITYEGLPPDFYLKLTGAGAKMLRGELPVTAPIPKP